MPRLIIPDGAKCLTPNCRNSPTHILSLRMRRVDSSASWAPNLPAYFCENCANNGGELEIKYTPTRTHKKSGLWFVLDITIEVWNGLAMPKYAYRKFDLVTKRDA